MAVDKLFQVEKELKEKYKHDFMDFKVGDTISLTYKIKEKEKERLHSISGIVIKKQNDMHRRSVTLRRIASGIGMEVTFPLYSPIVEKIVVVQAAKRKPRRAKLYYLRDRVGKKATTV